MNIARTVIATSVAVAFATVHSPAVAAEEAPTPQHAIVCEGDANQPTRSGTAVSVSGAVECNGSVDIANTYITVQINENGSFRNYGNPTSTSSTSSVLILSDGAPGKSGCWRYRTRIHREAFHGNWGTNDWYSNGYQTLCF